MTAHPSVSPSSYLQAKGGELVVDSGVMQQKKRKDEHLPGWLTHQNLLCHILLLILLLKFWLWLVEYRCHCRAVLDGNAECDVASDFSVAEKSRCGTCK